MPPKIIILAVAQSCYWFAVLIGISLSSIIGIKLAPHASLATLPFGLVSLGALISTYALSVLMQQRGRRLGLRLGAFSGACSAFICAVSIYIESFSLFCLGSLLMGGYQASSVFYRLAAMDEAPESKKGSVMGWVLSGSLLAAVLGPTLANYANQWFSEPPYLGAYLFVGIFAVIAFLLLGVLSNPVINNNTPAHNTRRFLRNSTYRVGVINTAFGQFVMMLMMVVTPLAMHAHEYSTDQGVSVIGWHIIGMFFPSFFTGKLIDRFGTNAIVYAGLVIFSLSAISTVFGMVLMNFYVSLFLLGVGWNFLYMSGTGQYSSAIDVDEKGKGQGVAELIIAFSSIIAVIGGGVLINWLDWQQLNYGVLVLLLGMAALNLFARD
ncbi:MFS transporter [Vibrio sp. WJH972]